MAKNFKELQAKMPREAGVRSEEAAKKMISEIGLAELGEAMDLTQESLADTLHVKQASISKMERRSDTYVSTLSKIIEAMGGELQIIANMPNGRVQLCQSTKIRKGELNRSKQRAVPRSDKPTRRHVVTRTQIRGPRERKTLLLSATEWNW
jgi:plasmid maintenance system antidote protein VapI